MLEDLVFVEELDFTRHLAFRFQRFEPLRTLFEQKLETLVEFRVVVVLYGSRPLRDVVNFDLSEWITAGICLCKRVSAPG